MVMPTKRTKDIEDAILEGLREGTPLAEICRRGKEYPHPTVWRDWCAADQALAYAYAAARDDGFDKIALETLRIADTPVEGKRVKVSEDGTETVTEDALGHRKLQIDTRRWLLARWDPKRYGDKIETHLSGDVGVKHTADPQALTSLASSLRAAARKPEAPKEDGTEFV